MKFINLDGLTTAERLVVLENICNDIIAHLNKETLYTTVDEYSSFTLNYDITKLNPKTEVMPESGQLVYFSNGFIGIIGNINSIENTFGVSEAVDIKGQNGEDGANGEAATITGITATVDDKTGTPSCEVIQGGTPQARSYAFAFHNLKGEKGDTGSSAGIQEVSVSGNSGTLSEDDVSKLNDQSTVIVRGNERFYYNCITISGQHQYISFTRNNDGTITIKYISVMLSAKGWNYRSTRFSVESKYYYMFTVYETAGKMCFGLFLNDDINSVTIGALAGYIQNSGAINNNVMIPATGWCVPSAGNQAIYGVYSTDGMKLYAELVVGEANSYYTFSTSATVNFVKFKV